MSNKFTPQQFIQQAKSMLNSFNSNVFDGTMAATIGIEEEFDKNFDRQGFFDEKWKPNSEITKKIKGHDKILHRTGKLRKNKKKIFGETGGGFGTIIYYESFSPRGVDYAPLQQGGFVNSNHPRTLFPNAKIPARPFIGRHKVIDARVYKELSNRVFDGLNRNYTIGR